MFIRVHPWLKILGLLFILSATTLPAADWPQFLGPTRNAVSTETNLAAKWPVEGPRVLWSKKVGQGFSGPAVADNKLILFHRLADKETVECWNPKTGEPIWKFDYPTHYQDDFGFDDGPRATPTIADGKVFTFGAEGALHCLNLATGKKLWSVDCKTQFQASKGFFGMVCSPLVEGNFVLLNIGGANDAGIVAFNVTNGTVAWKSTDHAAGYSSPVAATIHNKRHAIFFTRQGLVDLNPKDGKVFFDFPWRSRMDASVNAATPIVVGDEVFLSACYDTGAILLNIANEAPKKVWSSDDALSNHYATSVYRDGFLFGFHGRTDPGYPPCSFRCVEWKTGKVRWSEDNFGPGTAMLAGDKLLLLSEKGELVMAKASDKKFEISNRAQILPFGVRAAPALANGNFYARSKDKMVCVDLK